MVVYKKENGDYYYRFQLKKKRFHGKCYGATSVKQAKEIEYALMYKITQRENGVIPQEETNKWTLNDLFEDYKKYSKTNRSVYKQDKARLKISANFFDLKRKADSITRKDIDAFKDYLLTQGRSKKTINLYLAIFQKMYNLAIENERVKKNPFKSEVFFKLNPTKMQYLSKDEISTLLDASPDYFSPLIITALNTGLRVGNILNLKWNDINFKLNIIELVENKGKKHMRIPMNEKLIKCLNGVEKTSDYVFINPHTGEPWNRTTFGKLWRKVREKANLNDFKFHGLRHTVGSILASEGVSIPTIKALLAHSDVTTTMRYIHVAPKELQNATDVLKLYN